MAAASGCPRDAGGKGMRGVSQRSYRRGISMAWTTHRTPQPCVLVFTSLLFFTSLLLMRCGSLDTGTTAGSVAGGDGSPDSPFRRQLRAGSFCDSLEEEKAACVTWSA
jgi:hypothetical protein